MRNAGYGWLAVAIALVLRDRGYSAEAIGALLTLALAAGAVYAALSGRLVRNLDRRATLVIASLVMAVSGVLLATQTGIVPTAIAMLLGTIGAGTQEVGPFTSLEQTLIADCGGSKAGTYFGYYNIAGALAIALGAAIPAMAPAAAALWGYAIIAVALACVYATLPAVAAPAHAANQAAFTHVPRAVERLAALFALDAFGGGMIVQSFMVYWFAVRFNAGAAELGVLFFAANLLAACSLIAAAPLAARIGPVRTMVFTHLPSNVLLGVIPLLGDYYVAAGVLLVRFALSQIDVPVRQALVMAIVPPQERPRAAGVTNAVRPAAAALGPVIAGFAMSGSSIGLPFYLAGGIKIAYDLIIMAQFHDLDAKLMRANR